MDYKVYGKSGDTRDCNTEANAMAYARQAALLAELSRRNPSKDYGHNDKARSPWLKWGK